MKILLSLVCLNKHDWRENRPHLKARLASTNLQQQQYFQAACFNLSKPSMASNEVSGPPMLQCKRFISCKDGYELTKDLFNKAGSGSTVAHPASFNIIGGSC